jgi:hypothetical protein
MGSDIIEPSIVSSLTASTLSARSAREKLPDPESKLITMGVLLAMYPFFILEQDTDEVASEDAIRSQDKNFLITLINDIRRKEDNADNALAYRRNANKGGVLYCKALHKILLYFWAWYRSATFT